MRRFLPLLLLAAVACSAGPQAPTVNGSDLVCVESFCAGYPDGWSFATGTDFISFQIDDADLIDVVANAANFDPQGVVEAVGGTWPAPTREVSEAFWQLLAEGSGASLDEIVVLDDGSVRSRGGFDGGVLWHRMIINADGSGVGIEMRAPNDSWEPHADVFLDGLVVQP